MNHLLFKYLWFRACAALNFHCFHNPVVIKEWQRARMETLLPLPKCASALAHVWDGYEYIVVLFYAGYRLFTYDSRVFSPRFHSFVPLLFYGYGIVYLISPILSAWKLPSDNYSPFKIKTCMLLRAHCEVCFKENTTKLLPSNTAQEVPCQVG